MQRCILFFYRPLTYRNLSRYSNRQRTPLPLDEKDDDEKDDDEKDDDKKDEKDKKDKDKKDGGGKAPTRTSTRTRRAPNQYRLVHIQKCLSRGQTSLFLSLPDL